ncbi:MAG: OsmC family protein [Ignavibacteria bacterium]|nr:OsmC family protein [Ignavibacteria bacterium]
MEIGNNKKAGVRQKQFSFSTSVTWLGEKKGVLASAGKPSIQVSSPPEFKGIPGHWTPEDLFVGALEMCQFLTFLALAKRSNVNVVSYDSTASGTLEFVDRSFRFTKVLIEPAIVVAGPVEEFEIHALVSQAHRQCLVANSVTAAVIVNPRVSIEQFEQLPDPPHS